MAATKYFEVCNTDNIVTIDDTYRNLVYDRSAAVKKFVKCEQYSSFDASNTQVYQYFEDSEEWEAFISFDTSESNEFVSIRPRPSEDIKFYMRRAGDTYMFSIRIPKSSGYGTDEAHLQNYLSLIRYNFYNEHELDDPEHGCGLILYNENGKVIFNSDEYYMYVLDYFYRCVENLTDAQEVFKNIVLEYDEDIEIAPFSACNFWRYSPQVSLNYRTYIQFLANNKIRCGIGYYGGAFNQGELGINGPLQIVTSFMVLRRM